MIPLFLERNSRENEVERETEDDKSFVIFIIDNRTDNRLMAYIPIR